MDAPSFPLTEDGGGEVVNFPASDNPFELQADLQACIIGGQDVIEALDKLHPSRELSLVRTKLEEAEMWLDRHLNTPRSQPPDEKEGA